MFRAFQEEVETSVSFCAGHNHLGMAFLPQLSTRFTTLSDPGPVPTGVAEPVNYPASFTSEGH